MPFFFTEFPFLTQGIADMSFGNSPSGGGGSDAIVGTNGGPSPMATLYGGERHLQQVSPLNLEPNGTQPSSVSHLVDSQPVHTTGK